MLMKVFFQRTTPDQAGVPVLMVSGGFTKRENALNYSSRLSFGKGCIERPSPTEVTMRYKADN
uniref:Uncharacterized protein n=1 Tax=Chlorobium phaeobacteroides (strain BS1) TaxID=331678 RepID=B3EMX8_CHLPB